MSPRGLQLHRDKKSSTTTTCTKTRRHAQSLDDDLPHRAPPSPLSHRTIEDKNDDNIIHDEILLPPRHPIIRPGDGVGMVHRLAQVPAPSYDAHPRPRDDPELLRDVDRGGEGDRILPTRLHRRRGIRCDDLPLARHPPQVVHDRGRVQRRDRNPQDDQGEDGSRDEGTEQPHRPGHQEGEASRLTRTDLLELWMPAPDVGGSQRGTSGIEVLRRQRSHRRRRDRIEGACHGYRRRGQAAGGDRHDRRWRIGLEGEEEGVFFIHTRCGIYEYIAAPFLLFPGVTCTLY